jgi:hypothetical protein
MIFLRGSPQSEIRRLGPERGRADPGLIRREFCDDMVDLHHVVCLRGGGNFWVRPCETPVLGRRIPLFGGTHCELPVDGMIDWRK